MKYLYQLLAILIMWLLLFCSCATKKHLVKSAIVTANTDKSSIASVSSSSDKISSETNSKDSSITIPQKFVSGRLRLQDLKPLYRSDGVAVPQIFEVKEKGLSSRITVFGDSSIEHSATSDSMILVIKNLVTRLEKVERNHYKNFEKKEIQKKEESITYYEFFKKTGSFLWSKWLWIVGFIVLIFLDSIIKFFKRKIS